MLCVGVYVAAEITGPAVTATHAPLIAVPTSVATPGAALTSAAVATGARSATTLFLSSNAETRVFASRVNPVSQRCCSRAKPNREDHNVTGL